MSRSYRKPWVKDPNNRKMKKISARIYRSRCRQISRVFTKHWIDPLWVAFCEINEDYQNLDLVGYDDPAYPHRRQVIGQYDVCDYRFYIYKRTRHRLYWGAPDEHIDNIKEHKAACRK